MFLDYVNITNTIVLMHKKRPTAPTVSQIETQI